MKTLAIISIILGILATYFTLNTSKLFSVNNANGVIPAGVDVAKLILNQAEKLNPAGIISGNGSILSSQLTNELKSKIGDISNEIYNKAGEISNNAVNLIKTPIENKASSLICPQK